MKFAIQFLLTNLSVLMLMDIVVAFTAPTQQQQKQTSVTTTVPSSRTKTRHDFLYDIVTKVSTISILTGVVTTNINTNNPNDVAYARGRATLEVSYRKFTPRIIAGGEFYSKDLKQYVATNNYEAIQLALQEPPSRTKDDLRKPDSGVSERAKQAGAFSDARVLAAADLFASSFSESSISSKTKKMQLAVKKLRDVITEMEDICKQGLGQETSGGGLFGIGAKKVDKNELAKRLRQLYVEGGNAYNEYVLAANTDLALQFDKLPYIK